MLLWPDPRTTSCGPTPGPQLCDPRTPGPVARPQDPTTNMQEIITSENFKNRIRQAISMAWSIFMRKVGNGILPISKEASMQLQYAYILQQLLPLITFKSDEKAEIELETGVNIGEGIKEVDLILKGQSDSGEHNIAVEMKCYKTYGASGVPLIFS